MRNLTRLALKEIKTKYREIDIKIKTDEGLERRMKRYKKTYVGSVLEKRYKLKKLLEGWKNKEIAELLEKIEEVKNAPNFKGDFIITLEWKKSYRWGANPRAYTNYGYVGQSIGGCGYCKRSTATAEALNSNKSILKLLWRKKEKWLREHRGEEFTEEVKRSLLHYGCGYGILPDFEGGVGIGSHQSIIEGLGLKMEQISNTDWTDVFLIAKKRR